MKLLAGLSWRQLLIILNLYLGIHEIYTSTFIPPCSSIQRPVARVTRLMNHYKLHTYCRNAFSILVLEVEYSKLLAQLQCNVSWLLISFGGATAMVIVIEILKHTHLLK